MRSGSGYDPDMPLFRRVERDESGFVNTRISAEIIAKDEIVTTSVDKQKVVLTRIADEVVGISAECPHAAADLSGGDVRAGRISCPDHGWKFDMRSGRTIWPEDEACRLTHYEVNVRDGIVWLRPIKRSEQRG